jgi:hypothetical protein
MSFPLEQWFDVTKKIDKYDLDLCLAQMELYAIKQGDVSDRELKLELRKARKAVIAHNEKFAQ